MCKFKIYKSEIEKTRKAISLRFTFFSKPDFLSNFVSKQSGVLGDSFAVRELTDEESEAIDVDVISHILHIPLDYVLKEKNIYIFRNVDFGGNKARVFISKYFIFIQIKAATETRVDVTSERQMDFLKMEGYQDSIDLIDVSMVDDYVLGCDRAELWNVLDKNAFADVDMENVVDCRYADTHNRANFKSDLVRTILKRHDSEDKEICQIFLKSIISKTEPDSGFIADLRNNLAAMKSECEHEVTRCFSETF